MGLNSSCRVSVFKSDQLLNVINRPFDKVFADFLHDRTTKMLANIQVGSYLTRRGCRRLLNRCNAGFGSPADRPKCLLWSNSGQTLAPMECLLCQKRTFF